MKTVIFNLIFIGSTILLTAQTDANIKNIFDYNGINSAYLNTVSNTEDAMKVKKLQAMIASYKIKENSIFEKSKEGTYEVNFDEKNCKIKAIYADDGTIVESDENYKNIKLPIMLNRLISKQYPQSKIVSNEYSIKYNKKQPSEGIYQIKIQEGKTIKILKYNVSNDPRTSYLAVN